MLLLKLVSLVSTLRRLYAFDGEEPPSGCGPQDRTGWTMEVEPSEAPRNAVSRAWDMSGTEFYLNAEYPDINLTLSTGTVIPASTTLMWFEIFVWYNSKVDSVSVYTHGQDNTTWTHHGTLGPSQGWNWRAPFPLLDEPVDVLEILVVIQGGNRGTSAWGLRDFIIWSCGPTSTTTKTSTTSSTSTATTSTLTTSTRTTTTVTSSTTSSYTATATSTTTSSATSTSTTVTTSTSSTTSITITTLTASTTSTSTSSSSFTSTTTTLTVPPSPDAGVLLEWASSQEDTLLGALQSSPSSQTLVTSVAGVTIAASRVDASAVGNIVLPVAGTNVTVVLPGTSLRSVNLEEGFCVVTVFDPASLKRMSTQEAEWEVAAAVSIKLFDEGGTRVSVENVPAPVLITMPVNRSLNPECAYWDEAEGRWDTQRVGEADAEIDFLVCATYHLSLFAALWRGIINTLLCTQLDLFSAESVEELWASDWYKEPIAITFEVFVLVFLGMLIIACLLDHRRKNAAMWADEYFLIPVGHQCGPSSETADSTKAAGLYGMMLCLWSSIVWCTHSSALRDAIDDVVTRWLEWFSEVRDFVEGIWDGMQLDRREGSGGLATRVAMQLMSSLIKNSARKQACASLGLSADVVHFLTEDEDLGELLLHAAKTRGQLEEGLVQDWERRVHAWAALHDDVICEITFFWHRTGWRYLPGSVCNLFLVSNPFTAVFLGCHFWTSSLRVLVLASELLGAMAMAALFFQASGGVSSKRNRADCDKTEGIWYDIGRLIAVAFVSLIVAGLPVVLMTSLHSRSFKKFDHEGSPAWNKQLKVWRVQDRILWVLGLTYVSCCTFYVILFLANVSAGDLPSFGVSAAVSVLEDTLAIPLAVGLLVPLLAASTLAVLSFAQSMSKKDMLHFHRKELEQSKGNWYQLVTSI